MMRGVLTTYVVKQRVDGLLKCVLEESIENSV